MYENRSISNETDFIASNINIQQDSLESLKLFFLHPSTIVPSGILIRTVFDSLFRVPFISFLELFIGRESASTKSIEEKVSSGQKN